VFSAIPTITPFATGCSNGSPNATFSVPGRAKRVPQFTGLDLHIAQAPRARARRSEPPHDRLNRLITAARPGVIEALRCEPSSG
jgi:hypothetical protein